MDWKGVEKRIVQDDQNKWDQKVSSDHLRVTRAGALELSDGPGLTGCYSLSEPDVPEARHSCGILPAAIWRDESAGLHRLLGCRDSPPPVTWLATTMHYSHNEDEIRFDGVKNSIRENARRQRRTSSSRTRQRSGDSRIRRIVSSTASTNRRASPGSRSA